MLANRPRRCTWPHIVVRDQSTLILRDRSVRPERHYPDFPNLPGRPTMSRFGILESLCFCIILEVAGSSSWQARPYGRFSCLRTSVAIRSTSGKADLDVLRLRERHTESCQPKPKE